MATSEAQTRTATHTPPVTFQATHLLRSIDSAEALSFVLPDFQPEDIGSVEFLASHFKPQRVNFSNPLRLPSNRSLTSSWVWPMIPTGPE